MDRDRSLAIAFFSDSALPVLNGVSISVDSLMKGLRERGHTVHLFTAGPRRQDDPPHVHRCPATETPWARGYPLAIPPFSGLLLQFTRHDFDLVHTHTPWTVGYLGLRWARWRRLPVVSTYHTIYDHYAHYVPYVPQRYVRRVIARHTHVYYNAVSHVITPSQAPMQWLRRHGVRTPITIIPTATPQSPLPERDEARAALGIAPDARVLLYVGRLAEEKNLETLLDAAARILPHDPTVLLLLVGDGPHREACERLVGELGIADRVRFEGAVPRSEVGRYYAAADLFTFGSVTETQGLVVGEALAAGLPAVVVRGGGAMLAIRDGENGVLCENSPEDLARAIEALLRDEPRRRRMATEARRSARAYSLDEMVDRVLEIYRLALAESRHRERASVSR